MTEDNKKAFAFIVLLLLLSNDDEGSENHSSSGLTFNPVTGIVTSYFGNRLGPISKKQEFHNGLDIGAVENAQIFAVGDGIVEKAEWSNGSGWFVLIDHRNGYKTKYNHMIREPLVKKGQEVLKAQQIGNVGSTGKSTGNHLHFTIFKNGVAVDPTKVMPYLVIKGKV